jgi:AcrR family transcriptional regulator
LAVISHDSRTGGKLPRGPHQLSSEEVAADQRRRLMDAMVELAGLNSYTATTVAELIERAEVSRKTFYTHYDDREDLLKAAFEDSSRSSFEEVKLASQRSGGSTRQLEALVRRLCRSARERVGMIALCSVEITAANPSGLELREQLVGQYGALIQKCLSPDGKQPMRQTLAITLAGALHRSIDAHLRMGHGKELTALAPQLARWTRSHHPVPPSLQIDVEPVKPWPSVGSNGLVGGRAPGTLALAPRGYLPRTETRSRGFLAHANRERILDAVAQLTAAHGYPALTAVAIAEHADLSERAFLAHFKSKDEAFAAAIDLGHAKGQAIVERARAGDPDWRSGVRSATHALLEFFASEPDFTRMALVEAPLAGPAMARPLREHTAAYARLMLDGAPQRRRPAPVVPEAVVHGLFELTFAHAAKGTTAELPRVANEATYLTLAPFLGVREAAEVAV